MILISITIFELPLIGIHSTVSRKLFVCFFNSRMCYGPGSTDAIGHGCWASLFSSWSSLCVHSSAVQLRLQRLMLCAWDALGSGPGAGLEHNCPQSCFAISHFASNTSQITEKKKALFVPQGKRANHKVNFNVLTKQNKYQRHNLEKYQLMYNLPIVGIRLYLSSIDPFHYLFPFALLRKQLLH